MAAVGIVQLAERLLNQNNTQSQDTQNNQRVTSRNQGPLAAAQDQFTPSARAGQGAAQEAGLFSVAQFSFFSAAAEFLLAQNTPPPGDQPAAATPLLTAPTVLNAPPAGPLALPPVAPAAKQPQTNPTTVAAAANTPNTTGPAATVTGVGAAAGAPTAQGPLAIEQQIATLNQSLVALGLSPQEIQQLDRVASVINDFNPLAFISLAFQLEQLAQLSVPQPAATAPATTGNAGNAGNARAAANPTAGNQGPGAGGGFRVQELIIQFSGVQGQVNAAVGAPGNAAAAQGAGANTGFGVSAFNLRIEEVNLTLVNANGQTAQIQAPQRAGKAAHEAGANPPAAAGKARTTAA